MRARAGAVLAIVLLAGCASYDAEGVRREHVAEWRDASDAVIAALPDRPLGLEDCIAIALERNLDLRSAEIERRLATLDRKISFAALLPRLEARSQWHAAEEQPTMRFGSEDAPVSDRQVVESELVATMPILSPRSWLIHEAHRDGEAIGGLVRDRTRQSIVLAVTALYHEVVARDELRPSLVADLEQARVLLAEIRAFEEEGMTTPAAAARAEAVLLRRENALATNDRHRREGLAALLEAMGLPPHRNVRLARPEPDPEPDERPLEELVLAALVRRPELAIADREVAMREDEARAAVASILPDLSAFVSYGYTSDSFVGVSPALVGGIAGVLRLFDGFATGHRIDAAREREELARTRRERTALAVALEVVRAHLAVRSARDDREVAVAALRAAETVRREVDARWEEGLALPSERLDAGIAAERARAVTVTAAYREHVARAVLLDVTGAGERES
jgi:outer membrane protein